MYDIPYIHYESPVSFANIQILCSLMTNINKFVAAWYSSRRGNRHREQPATYSEVQRCRSRVKTTVLRCYRAKAGVGMQQLSGCDVHPASNTLCIWSWYHPKAKDFYTFLEHLLDIKNGNEKKSANFLSTMTGIESFKEVMLVIVTLW